VRGFTFHFICFALIPTTIDILDEVKEANFFYKLSNLVRIKYIFITILVIRKQMDFPFLIPVKFM